jgi:hypothetical protein
MFRSLAILILLSFLSAAPSLAQTKRVALVFGNSEYQNAPRLENPKNDASDVAEMLRKLGFAVVAGLDLDKASMDRTIRDFSEVLAGAEVGLFFYAGHGIQVGGQNYLVPIDAKLTSASAIDFEMVRLDLVQRTMEREANTNILIMDACRDNPLARNLARALGTRSTQIGRGLAPAESGEGTLISYSTQPGNVALDGQGRNSPYTAALLKHIATPGEDLPTVLINVRNDVMRETARQQVPWEHSAMTAKFFFIAPKPTEQQIEMEFWSSVKDSTNPEVLSTYAQKYPAGEYATIARALIEHYDRQLKLELAAREGERRRQEELMRAAEAKRLEDEQRTREMSLVAERARAEEAKNGQEARRLEKELQDRNEQLLKAREEARIAREAAEAAEKRQLAALKDAEAATNAARQAITSKQGETTDPVKIATLPKFAPLPATGYQGFDGRWEVTRVGTNCKAGASITFSILIANGKIPSGGRVANSGQITLQRTSSTTGRLMHFSGTLRGNTGSGTFFTDGGQCQGTFRAVRR